MTVNKGRYRLIVDLPPGLVREAETIVGPDESYTSISALLAVALANQLQLERTASGEIPVIAGSGEFRGDSDVSPHEHPSIGRPVQEPPIFLPPVSAQEPLSAFTNRLAPLIAPLRVLSGLQNETGSTVEWGELTRLGARAAREVGLGIRKQDEHAGRRGHRRRWTGWPVGADEAASLARFRSHFLGRVDREAHESPLLALGLIGIRDGEVGLTSDGWQFVRHPTPILGEVIDEGTLTSEQRFTLASALSRLPKEWARVNLTLRALTESDGDPMSVEHALADQEPNWTKSMVASLRSGIIGRLADAGLVRTEGKTGRVFPVHGDYSSELDIRV